MDDNSKSSTATCFILTHIFYSAQEPLLLHLLLLTEPAKNQLLKNLPLTIAKEAAAGKNTVLLH
jgi:hypothetical protein